MNHCVGIIGRGRGWQLLLEQEGIPFSPVIDEPQQDQFSVVVASDDADERESQLMRNYLKRGGAVLCSVKVYAQLRRGTDQRGYVKFVIPNRHSIFTNIGLIDIEGKCHLAWNANELPTNREALSAYCGKYENGFIIALPCDPSMLIADDRSASKSFYSPERRLPFERVSLVSKGAVRLLVSHCLEILHHKRGLPYVHIWYYPHGARSIFSLRIDTDRGTRDQIDSLYRLADHNHVPMSWFIDVKSQESFLPLYAAMKNQEIGVHCYEHKPYRDASAASDLQKALDILHQAGIVPKGSAAPYGIWSNKTSAMIAQFGFEYSSEFSYDYDNIPGLPETGPLQIPVHPICIGSLKRHSYDEQQMIRYFDFVVRRKLAAREPLFFYHHPRDGFDAVLEWLFESMRRERVPMKTMVEFSSWWHKRLHAAMTCESSGTNVILDGGGMFDKEVYVRITRWDGTEAIVPAGKQINLETMRWEPKPPAFLFPDDFLRHRQFNYRVPLLRSIDAVAALLKKEH